MNENLDLQYSTGEEVTDHLAPKQQPMVVLSVRVSAAELEALQAIADAEGRSVSQIARKAIASYAEESGGAATSRAEFSVASESISVAFMSGPQSRTDATQSEYAFLR